MAAHDLRERALERRERRDRRADERRPECCRRRCSPMTWSTNQKRSWANEHSRMPVRGTSGGNCDSALRPARYGSRARVPRPSAPGGTRGAADRRRTACRRDRRDVQPAASGRRVRRSCRSCRRAPSREARSTGSRARRSDCCLGLDVFLAGRSIAPASGSALRSSFPFGQQRELVEHRDRRRDHVVGKLRPEERQQVGPVRRIAPVGVFEDDIGGELDLPPRRVDSRRLRCSTTASCSRRIVSISPSSTRKPRTFTWSSIRPRNSNTPSDVQRPRSPVR